ncbi:MAG: leucine-rich repeat protein, partial [Ruminococcus sp.]|nr:leucine-rich repeat protein [Ruminococcus sp.]
MKKFKRVAALALAVLMAQSAVSVATVSASAAVVSNVAVSAGELLDSGTCGDDVTWSLYKNGLLSIVGTGRMENYSTENKAPWYESRTRIQDIAISNGVTEIGSCAFRNCNYAVSASIPSTVTSIGDSAFLGCFLLDNVSISGNVTDICANAFSDCKSLTKFVFPKGLETIGDAAFANTGLKMVSFSDTVTTIGKNVFVNCTKLSVAVIPSNVTEIGHTVFGANAENFAVYGYSESYAESYCQQNNLRFVALDEFYDCGTCGESILWMLDNDGVMYIRGTGDMNNYIKAAAQPWYDYKTKINSIVIEEGVNSIGDFAFYGCKYATDVTVPDTINSIGKNAFYSCISLKNIELPASVEYINAYAFYKCTSLQAITIPSGIKDIGNYAFSNCTILKTVNFDKGVEVLTGTYIFNKCTSLEEISLPKTLTSVPKNMFANCSALQKVTIPAPVVLISTGVFNYTSSNLVICGYEGTFAEEYADGNDYEFSPLRPKADGECGENLKWVLDEDNDLTIYGSGDMYDYTDVRVPWSEYSSEISEVIIASGVTSIGSNAFEEFSNINKVIVPDTITKIGDSAFTGCSNITEFRFPKNLTSIGNSAFERCDLSVVTLPETVVSIGNKAFRNNHNLIKAEIPRNIEVVGTLAFDGDSEDLTIYGYTNSPAQKYALSEDIKFESIGVIPIIEPTEPATSATTSTDSTDSTSSTDATEYTEAPTSYTVYYDNSISLWSDVYVYYWNENDSSVQKEWPGVKMTSIGNKEYKAVIPANITNVAFNNNKGSQTLDLSSPNGNKI